MACPSCDHTMNCIVDKVFWCPRCGTVKIMQGHFTPALLDRVKLLVNEMNRIGIIETVITPTGMGK